MIWTSFSDTARESIRDSIARINIWEGAVRSGKTIASLIRWIEYIATAPPGPLLMVGKTERTLKRNILDPLEEILGPKRVRINKGTGEALILGRRVYLVGANDERSEQKIRGGTFAGAYGDEITLWPESFFKMLLSRLSVAGAMFFGTTNPDSPYHWLKVDYLNRSGDLELKSWKFELSNNTSLDPAYIANLQKEYTGLWHQRFIKGLWVVAEGVVYDMFDEAKQVVSDTFELKQYWVSVDYGTVNPTVFLMGGFDQKGRLIITDEWRWDPAEHHGQQRTDLELSDELVKFTAEKKPQFVFADPSAASFRLQAFRAGVRNITPADNAVLDGIREVSSLMSAGYLLIHESCTGLIGELTAYTWNPKAQKKGEDEPNKINDHSVDALRYLVRGTRAHWMRSLKLAA